MSHISSSAESTCFDNGAFDVVVVVVVVVVVEVVVVVTEVDVFIAVVVDNTVLAAAFDSNVVAVDFVVGLKFDFVEDFVDEYDTLSVTVLNISVFVSMRSSAFCTLFE